MARSGASTLSNHTTKPGASLTTDAVKSDAGAVAQEAQNVASQIAAEVTSTASQIADEAKAELRDQAGKIKGIAGEQKDLFATQIAAVAEAVDKVAGELETNGSASAKYARTIANNADKASAIIRDNDVDALFNIAQDFGRRQPAAFIGAAALLGFAASRFLIASANRPAASASAATEADFGEGNSSYPGTPSGTGTQPYESGRE